VFCGIKGQKIPEGYYNIERMLKDLRKAEVKACGGCMDARGLSTDHLLSGIMPSNMQELNDWVVDSDKVINF